MATSEDGGQSPTTPAAPATRVDPEWINIDTIKSWISDCNHSHECMKGSRFGKGPTWVIDVQEECLVSGASLSPDSRYCALSYVWGQAEATKLTVQMIPLFQAPGAFSPTQDQVVIPKTVRHAMGLVSLIGERYLWVDALCVAQDDRSHFGTELRNMGAIYNRAYVTIVAATGRDADEGLSGLPGITPRRRLAANYADDLVKYSNPGCMIWTSRGWTFQEGQLSRRMLMFCDQTILWNCHQCTVDEAGQTPTRSVRAKSEGEDGGTAPAVVQRLSELGEGAARGDRKTQLANFFKSISDYNRRSFRQPADVSLAFEGLVGALTEQATPDGCFWLGALWGMPVACFHDALLWGTESTSVVQRPGIPSWSWLRSEGEVGVVSADVFDFVPDMDPEPMCWVAFSPSETVIDMAYSERSTKSIMSNSKAYKKMRDVRRETLSTDLAGGSFPPLHIMAEVTELIVIGTTPFASTAPLSGLGYSRISWPNLPQPNFSIIIPDHNDVKFNRYRTCVTLMAVSKMRGQFSDKGRFYYDRGTYGCVNALWIELDRNTGIAHRLGQARVRQDLWDMNPPPGSICRRRGFVPLVLV